jgi:protein ImuA
MTVTDKSSIIVQLKKEMLVLGGYKFAAPEGETVNGLSFMNPHFPNGSFPKSAIHEFMCSSPEATAASLGFIGALVAANFPPSAVVVYIGATHTVYPAGLPFYQLSPSQVVFVRPPNKKACLCAVEESLKCRGLAVVIAELNELSFVDSRRFQLAVEDSNVTGFVLNTNKKGMTTTACISRWQVSSIASKPLNGMPGVGQPCWQVELQKLRNGRKGNWAVAWNGKRLLPAEAPKPIWQSIPIRKAG